MIANFFHHLTVWYHLRFLFDDGYYEGYIMSLASVIRSLVLGPIVLLFWVETTVL